MSPLLRSLVDDLPRLSVDEQRFIRRILDRVLIVGRARYSPWKASAEKRDLIREASEEGLDGAIYFAMDAVQRADERQERMECETADKIVASFDVSDGEVSEVLR